MCAIYSLLSGWCAALPNRQASSVYWGTLYCLLYSRVVKRSSKIRSLIYKFEFEFSFLAFAIRGVHSINCTNALFASVMHGCTPSTGGWRGEIRLHNRNCDGRSSARRYPLSAVAQFLSSLDSNRLRERVQSACALKHGQQSVMLMPAAVLSPDVCFPEKLSQPAVRVQRRPLIKPTNARSSHSFDGFHTRI